MVLLLAQNATGEVVLAVASPHEIAVDPDPDALVHPDPDAQPAHELGLNTIVIVDTEVKA
jgi:hypothetical protein